MEDSSQLPDLVRALLNPALYPDKPDHIQLMQTQMSFVFLAGEYVYKVKKPVNLGYLDYTTLEKRRFFCQREVDLNRRLCPDTYLGVFPITKSAQHVTLGGTGETIDYVVKMRYLPQDRMMNVLLQKDGVTNEMVGRVAIRLVDFHNRAETNTSIGAFGEIRSISVNTEENFNQTKKSIGRTISRAKYERIRAYTRRFLQDNPSLFASRITRGRIRDLHGDLHAAHICFVDGICIYDCIEFNDRFRYGDVASEVAFLAMDLDHYGRADLSQHFVQSYVNSSSDQDLLKMLAFYKCYRAYVRGKVESFKLDDPYIAKREKAKVQRVAREYFDLAESYTGQ